MYPIIKNKKTGNTEEDICVQYLWMIPETGNTEEDICGSVFMDDNT